MRGTAVRWHADGFHQRSHGHTGLLHSAPVHNAREIADVKRSRPDLLFLSPLFDTNSHPGARTTRSVDVSAARKACWPKTHHRLGRHDPSERKHARPTDDPWLGGD
ncbi:hypothetical protein [Sphingorhabdus sp.]|uniref:hypothetical protein n=1 Tax=Sphingorhabdus sp. TaxID=1902408 RepID=UPI003D81433E